MINRRSLVRLGVFFFFLTDAFSGRGGGGEKGRSIFIFLLFWVMAGEKNAPLTAAAFPDLEDGGALSPLLMARFRFRRVRCTSRFECEVMDVGSVDCVTGVIAPQKFCSRLYHFEKKISIELRL